jgi:hypothetical protein
MSLKPLVEERVSKTAIGYRCSAGSISTTIECSVASVAGRMGCAHIHVLSYTGSSSTLLIGR